MNNLAEVITNTDLVVIENVNAVQVFQDSGLDPLLEQITKAARSLVPDVSTVKGRKEIASTAFRIAKSKTHLDDCGKNLVADWKTKSKAVDAERKRMRDTLDALKSEVRKPLSDWEQAEQNRIETRQQALDELRRAGPYAEQNWLTLPLDEMRDRLSLTEAEPMGGEIWQEFEGRAVAAKDSAIASLKDSIFKREHYDAEQSELARLRQEADEREEQDRRNRASQERRNRAAQVREERAQAVIEAQEAAERRAEEVVQHERERAERARIAEEAESLKRKRNLEHQGRINTAVFESFVAGGLEEESAKLAVKLIAKNKISHVVISY